MIHDPQASIDAIASYLDELDHSARLDLCQGLGRADQRRLYVLAAAAPPIDAEHFVPADRSARQEVVHHGVNTLPLPAGFKRFEKRFCRPEEDAADRVFGYNEGAVRPYIGPGYFVGHDTAGNDAWGARGPYVINYFKIPDGPVVEGWPTVVPNSKGLQMLVYNKTRDFMRRVSTHVSIGAAYKNEKSLGQFFVLCRED
jgi:hypothetical protein